MKVSEVELGQIFILDHTLSRPKLKLKEGFLDIVPNYVYVCWGDWPAEVLTETQIYKLRQTWGMTEESFKKFKQALIRGHQ